MCHGDVREISSDGVWLYLHMVLLFAGKLYLQGCCPKFMTAGHGRQGDMRREHKLQHSRPEGEHRKGTVREPADSFYEQHASQCAYVNRCFTADGSDGTVILYESPESAKVMDTWENGFRVYLSHTSDRGAHRGDRSRKVRLGEAGNRPHCAAAGSWLGHSCDRAGGAGGIGDGRIAGDLKEASGMVHREEKSGMKKQHGKGCLHFKISVLHCFRKGGCSDDGS